MISNSFIGLVFCLVNENSLNCTSGLVLLCFFFRQNFCYDHMTSQTLNLLFYSFVHAIKTEMTSELTYETLNFMNIYLLKANSVHLISAKHMP